MVIKAIVPKGVIEIHCRKHIVSEGAIEVRECLVGELRYKIAVTFVEVVD
jgi:hypothetical protein